MRDNTHGIAHYSHPLDPSKYMAVYWLPHYPKPMAVRDNEGRALMFANQIEADAFAARMMIAELNRLMVEMRPC